ncbi:glycosyltransferase family 61 protein [Blastopirellula retiformator]|uniref:Glycosyltransferase 61 catalytic domain-containing protein n=1 Tax=Blastopirellula retiformator TaxID=2527970 RepID=A0A5C5VBA7_9BACT|nr:glycosyltransferase family 61 protein [Blastopirellula retiformator]TWT34875.1 hypothetical protein Enr8_22900 [Blastopirellula retiformator]
MRFNTDGFRRIRNIALRAWWKGFGVAAPTKVCHEAKPQIEVEPASQYEYGQRTMYGAIDEVGPAVEQMIAGDHLSVHDRQWNGESTIDYPASGISFLDQGSVVGRSGILISPEHGVMEDLGGSSLASLLDNEAPPSHLPRPTKVKGDVLAMTRFLAHRNYYHWTLEMLSQLRLLEQADVSYDYVAASKRRAFARQTLELLGIPAEKIVLTNHYTHLQADRLIVPSAGHFYPQAEGVRYLRERMRRQSWSHYDRDDRLKLYIARRKSLSRNIVNEEELFAQLEPLGFQKVYLEYLPLKRQIQLFQRAGVVVGPHGAGFTNLVYSPPRTAVFEITPTCRPALFFHYLAEINEQPHAVYFGQPAGQRGSDANIQVDAQDVRRSLSEFLETIGSDRQLAAA